MEEGAQDVITMNKGDMKRLEEGEYLNDNLIDFKIKILMEQLKVWYLFFIFINWTILVADC